MSKIKPIDRLFITVVQNGMARVVTELSGVNSFADVVSTLRNSAPCLSGLATFKIRNSTEGWTSCRSVFLR